MVRLVLLFLLSFACLRASAQCTAPDFAVQGSACIGENVSLTNDTAGTPSYEWDFCSGDLELTPTASIALNAASFANMRSLRIIREGANYYGFAISSISTGTLLRLDFGTDVESPPVVTVVGNTFGISSSFGFDMYREGGIWYAFVANAGASVKNILRLKFASGLAAQPETQVLETGATFTSVGPNFIRIVKDADNVFGFVSASPNRIVRLSFGTSADNTSPAVTEFTVTGATELRGMSFVKECDQWISLAVGAGGTIFRLNFGADLTSTPTSTALATTPALSQPVNIEVRSEGGKYFAFIQNRRSNAAAAFYRIDFGSSILNNVQATTEFKPAEMSSASAGNHALEIIHENSEWYYFTINFTAQNLVRLKFQNACGASPAMSSDEAPALLQYTQPGAHQITLAAIDANNNYTYTTETVTISAQSAPDLTISSQNICAGHDVSFDSQNASGDIQTYAWDFGDGNVSADADPVHQFATAGNYQVQLVVTGVNGCANAAQIPLEIFNPPAADFAMPSATPLCTNQELVFENTTTGPASFLTYEWFIDGASETTALDLAISFANTGTKSIRLVATIPGCSHEATKITDDLEAGPSLDFTAVGKCASEVIAFTAEASEPVTGHSWDFDDGNTSTDENPVHSFANPGTFSVQLSATGAGGCVSTVSKPIDIFSKPLVDFSTAGAPNACSGSTTTFNNLTPDPSDSDIASWSWDFGDGSSVAEEQTTQHIFATANTYQVLLTATTDEGCSNSIEKAVVILQAPAVVIDHSPSCVDVPVTFDAPGTGIASFQWNIESSLYAIANPVHTFTASGDQQVELIVTGDNGCISEYDETVSVPAPLSPDFSVANNFLGAETVVTDITTGDDPVTGRNWDFDGLQTATGASAQYAFSSSGPKTVTLTVTTQAGCEYAGSKVVDVDCFSPPSFSAQPTACLEENIILTSNPSGAISYEWDFCSGDLESTPSATVSLSSAALSNIRSLRIVKEGDNYYGFAISSSSTGALLRLDFGSDVQSAPVITVVGNTFGISGSFGFDMYHDAGIWYAFVANAGSFIKNIVRLKFASGLSGQPEAQVVETGTVFNTAGPNFIRIVKNAGEFVGFVSMTPDKIVRLDFGTTLETIAPAITEFPVAGVSEIRGMDFVQECGRWIGLAVGTVSNSLVRLDFGSDLTSEPLAQVLATSPALSQPVNIEVRNEGGNYYAFIQNRRSNTAAAFYRVSFGEKITGTILSTTEFKPVEIADAVAGNYALEVVYDDSNWNFFTVNFTALNLVRLKFENSCGAVPGSSTDPEPMALRYDQPGTHKLTLTAIDADNNRTHSSAEITVSGQTAPDVTASSVNACANHDVNFTSENSSGGIVAYTWDFGDGNSASDANPVHQYGVAGDYTAVVEVIAANGCTNRAIHPVKIYDVPTAGFLLPATSPICTNQELTFVNTSSSPAGITTFEWFVDNQPVSSNEHLEYVFTSTGAQAIKLVAAIPGCNDEVIQLTPSIQAGPLLDFSVAGQCEGQAITFTPEPSEPVTGHSWNFDDGSTALDESPVHIFAGPGSFSVQLTAMGAGGCVSSITKEISIFSKPVVDLSAAGAPNACSGSVTTFTNLSQDPQDSNIISWVWDFGDGSSGSVEETPGHTFETADSYQVSLTATTSAGCSNAAQKEIVILQSPVVVISHTPSCVGVPVTFHAPAAGITSYEWTIESSNYAAASPVHTFTSSGARQIQLIVEGDNNCVSTSEQIVTVPIPLLPDFSVSNNYVGSEAVFMDITSGDDAVTTRSWDFDGLATATGATAQHTFLSAGSKTIGFSIVTESGCGYETQKSIDVGCFPVADFALQENACREESIQLTNDTAGNFTLEWDYCSGDLENMPVTGMSLEDAAFSNMRSLRIVRENGLYYGFALSSISTGVLIRLDFGDNVESTPVVTVLGSSFGISAAFGLEMFRDGDTWYGFITNAGPILKNIVRLKFSQGLNALPETAILETGTIFDSAGPNFFRIVTEGGNVFGFASVSPNRLIRLDFGASVENMTPAVHEFAVAGIVELRGMSFVKECDQWFALAVGAGSANVFRLNFGSDLTSVPLSESLASSLALSQPVNIEVRAEGGNYFAFVQNRRANTAAAFYRMSFGSSIRNQIASATEFKPAEISGTTAGNYAQEIIHDNSHWNYFTFNHALSRLVRLKFENQCGASPAWVAGNIPLPVRYALAGQHRITLSTLDAVGNRTFAIRQVTVADQSAPDIAISAAGVCVASAVNFAAESFAGNIADYAWDFGDGNASDISNPAHQFLSAGQYQISLSVTGANGCDNFASMPLTIYDTPVAAFALPPAQPVCTNQELLFANQTTGVNALTTFQWFVDDQPAGTEQDLTFTFNTTGTKAIKLLATIPGCSDEVTRQTTEVKTGPLLDFLVDGRCESEQITFTSQISEVVSDHVWNFGDGNILAGANVTHTFSGNGTYPITLTATSASGCVNSRSKNVTVFSKPDVDFDLNPALACTKNQTAFHDATPLPSDSELSSWYWNFGDVDDPDPSAEQHSSHVFVAPGTYLVSLTVETNQGCSATLEKSVEVQPSPDATITLSPACLGVPATFQASGSGIASYYWEVGTAYYVEPASNHTFQSAGNHGIRLTVIADNGCIVVYNETIDVPEPLTPDFTVTGNCVGTEATFVDATTGADAVLERLWDFDGVGEGSGQEAAVSFASLGEKTVSLKVTTASGCEYSRQKTIMVVEPPVASFTASQQAGGAPLNVSFTNTSVGATTAHWNFGDGHESTDFSPLHTFTQIGDVQVQLIASNNEGCMSSATETLHVLTAMPDVAIKMVQTSENPDGSLRVIITVENRGNNAVENLPIEVNLSDNAFLTEIIPGPIPPASLFNFVLGYQISRQTVLSFLCAEAKLENDIHPEGNRHCIEFGQSAISFHPYPNPASDFIVVEWIAAEPSVITLSLSDAFGKTHAFEKPASAKGLNQVRFDVRHLSSGIYFVTARDQAAVKTYRIVISREN